MSSQRLVVVIGATGAQGGSVISTLLKDPSYKLRAVTRNPTSEAAQKLSTQGVEIVSANLDDKFSLIAAFRGANIIFAVTNFWETFATQGPVAAESNDFTQGKNLADAAASTSTLEHYIWSAIPSGLSITNGKASVPHFEGKAKVDDYIIHSLPDLATKTTFLWVTYYGLNNLYFPMLVPNFIKSSGKYVVMWPVAEDTLVTTIGSPYVNVGLFVEGVLKNPELCLPSKYVLAESDTVTTGELVKLLADISGKPIEYLQVTEADYERLWPVWGTEVAVQMVAWEVAKERSWSKEGVKVVTKEDLKIKGLVGLRKVLEGADMSIVL